MHFPCTDLALEECPKWSALCKVLEEIREENSACDDPGRVLVAAADDSVCVCVCVLVWYNEAGV